MVSDFITLQPGESVSSKIDLLKSYWFPKEGKYFVSLKSSIAVYNQTELKLCNQMLAQNGFVDFITLPLTPSDVLPVNVLDRIAFPAFLLPTEKIQNGSLGSIVQNRNCSGTQPSTISSVDQEAARMVSTVRGYLGRACTSAPWYVTWMGACDSSRYSRVTTNFNNIASRISGGYRVDCTGSCGSGTYAYVYPSDAQFWVYLCGAFWSANANPTGCQTSRQWDTKPGTFVHEISHFTPVAGTNDNAYGTTACQNLAKSNPAQAIANADNHEYLTEQCPS